MTEIEAIENLHGCITSEEYENGKPNGNVSCDLTREILSISIQALKEKAEREKGCAFCKEFVGCFTQNRMSHFKTYKFCPMCGKKLEVANDN